MKSRHLFLALTAFLLIPPAHAQSCHTSTAFGGSSTVTNASDYEVPGTSLSNTNALDGNYYQVTNALGISSPSILTMDSNWVQTGTIVILGSTFVNPTYAPITVTQVDVTANANHFAFAFGITPVGGWTTISPTNVRWTGSIAVASRSAQDFVFVAFLQNNAVNNTTRQVPINVTVTTSAGPFAAAPFTQTAVTSTSAPASNATVTFDTTGANVPTPQLFVANQTSTAPVNLGVRVAETSGNGGNAQIQSGLRLTITIPPLWSSVSVPTIASPWSAATLTVVQPTATSSGQISISTNRRIRQGSGTPANSLVIRATAPVSSATNLFPFTLSLNGTSRGGRTIDSFNQSVVQVTGNGTTAINSQFLTSPIGPGPVRQIAFTAAFNVLGAGGESVTVNVWNTATSSWDLIQTVTPGSSNVTVSRTFTTDFLTHVDASNRMRIQLVSTGITARTLRVDLLQWTMTIGLTVNNATGSDTNVGDVARPFRTLAHANGANPAGSAVFVDVGASQSGTPYDPNIQITKAGASGCPTLFQGVASGGLLPLVRGITSSDFGFDIAANYVTVDGFRVENTSAALAVEPGMTGATISNNSVLLTSGGYGIIVNPSTNPTVAGNLVDGTGASPLFTIADFGSQGLLIDGNRVVNSSTALSAISLIGTASPVVQRNICSSQQYGIVLSGTTGTAKLYNNTIDNSMLAGIQSQSSGSIVAENNSMINNEWGMRSDTPGNITADYNDAFANRTSDYAGVTAGPNSISANPLFIQTTNPALSTFYRLNPGSPCIDRGINIGLPFLGAAPDIGAVESS